MQSIKYYEEINSSIRDTLNSVNSTWTKDQIIRFLYIKLAKYVHRDLQYFLQSPEERKRQFDLGFINRFPDTVCYTLSEFYCAALNEFGIDATVERANSATVPLYGIVVEGERGKNFLLPLEDLFLNQYGLMPKAFGIVPKFKTINMVHPNLVRLEDDYLSDIDESLGIEYIDQIFDSLVPQMMDFQSACSLLNVEDPSSIPYKDLKEQKLDYFGSHFINLGNLDGTFERCQLYKFLSEKFMTRRERDHVLVYIEDGLTQNPYVSITMLGVGKAPGNVYHDENTNEGYKLVLRR